LKAYLVSEISGYLSGDPVSMFSSYHFHGAAGRLHSKFVYAIEHYSDPAGAHHDLHLRKNSYIIPPIIYPQNASGFLVCGTHMHLLESCDVKLFPVVNDYIYHKPFGGEEGLILPEDQDYFNFVPNSGWPRSALAFTSAQYFEVIARPISPRAVNDLELEVYYASHGGVSKLAYYWNKSLARERFVYFSGKTIMDRTTFDLLEIQKYAKWFYITEVDLEE